MEGALVHAPSLTTNTFVGEVAIYTNILTEFGAGQLWAPNYPNGLHLIACPDPIGGPISSMFANVVGRSAAAGESVRILDETTQAYITATFTALAGTMIRTWPSRMLRGSTLARPLRAFLNRPA